MAVSSKDWKESIEDFFESRYTVVALLIVLIICVAVVLWMVTSEDQYEREGDRLSTESKYEEALNAYHQSLKNHSFGDDNKARITYKIAKAYYSTGDDGRAIDLLVGIMKDYPDVECYSKSKRLAEVIFKRMTTDVPGFVAKADTELGKSKAKFRKDYLKLLSLMEKNRSGVPASLVSAYEQYKESYEAYQRTFSASYKEAVKYENDERARLLQKSKVDDGNASIEDGDD